MDEAKIKEIRLQIVFLYEQLGSLQVHKLFKQLKENPNGFRFPHEFAELNKKFNLSSFEKVHHYEKT